MFPTKEVAYFISGALFTRFVLNCWVFCQFARSLDVWFWHAANRTGWQISATEQLITAARIFATCPSAASSRFRSSASWPSSGGEAGVSGEDEARLRAAGCNVYRIAGKNEQETSAKLDDLILRDTPWPGAPAEVRGLPPATPIPDEYTMPDDWPFAEEIEETPPPAQDNNLDAEIDVPERVPPTRQRRRRAE